MIKNFEHRKRSIKFHVQAEIFSIHQWTQMCSDLKIVVRKISFRNPACVAPSFIYQSYFILHCNLKYNHKENNISMSFFLIFLITSVILCLNLREVSQGI